jgi:two-component system, chemotaxis family, protein-glutamate methylesterase/glutaminase
MGTEADSIRVVAIGASTGGPGPVRLILSELPECFPVPVLVVQHISSGFAAGFVQWLAGATRLPVHLAEEGQRIEPGHAYVAPDGIHMGVGADDRIELRLAEPEHNVRPAVSYLFRSVIRQYGGNAVGVLLSGMGKDGAVELGAMRDLGAVTFAQNKETCVVFGMPGEAVRNGAAVHVLPPDRIAPALSELLACPSASFPRAAPAG